MKLKIDELEMEGTPEEIEKIIYHMIQRKLQKRQVNKTEPRITKKVRTPKNGKQPKGKQNVYLKSMKEIMKPHLNSKKIERSEFMDILALHNIPKTRKNCDAIRNIYYAHKKKGV